jgi:predicted enzyme related to lactoylglutathione lyase
VVSSHGRFVWYELVTTDVAAATAFYSRLMSWGAWDASTPGRPYILFGDGKSAISALTPLPDDARQMGVQPSWVGYVGVDDVDAAIERVARLGGAVQVPPTDVADISRFSGLHRSAERASRAIQVAQSRPATTRRSGRTAARVGWHELLAADWEQAWTFYAELFGWQREEADVSGTTTYQPFSAEGR